MKTKDIKNTERFERYLDGEMTKDERQKFEKALTENEELSLSFELHQHIIKQLDGSLKEDILNTYRIGAEQERYKKQRQELFKQYHNNELPKKEKLKLEQRLENEIILAMEWEDFQKEEKEKKIVVPHRKKTFFRTLVAMAAAVLLLVVGYSSFEKFNTNPFDELVASNYKLPDNYITDDNGLVIKGTKEEITNELLNNGLEAYNNGEFDIAIRNLNQYVNIEGNTDTANIIQLYIGTSFYEKNAYKKAIKAFETGSSNITENSDYRGFRDLIQWQLALTYLKTNQKEKAISLLEYLSKNAEYIIVEKDAKALLIQLKNIDE